VTDSAIMIKITRYMVWILHLLKCGLVTGIAGGRSPGVLGGVALNTCHLPVRAGKREGGFAVIIECRLPRYNSMTKFAVMRETRRLMVRVGSGGKLGAVTTVTVARYIRIPGTVTITARDTGMPAGQRE
jgi:hypothetical protein